MNALYITFQALQRQRNFKMVAPHLLHLSVLLRVGCHGTSLRTALGIKASQFIHVHFMFIYLTYPLSHLCLWVSSSLSVISERRLWGSSLSHLWVICESSLSPLWVIWHPQSVLHKQSSGSCEWLAPIMSLSVNRLSSMSLILVPGNILLLVIIYRGL